MTRIRVSFQDPDGRRHGGLPTFAWQCAPAGLATVRQLRAAGLRPGGQEIAAQIRWPGVGGTRTAYLYRVDAAKPKRTATQAQRAAIAAALEARRTCPECGLLRPYYISPIYRCCWTCAGLDPAPPGGRARRRCRAGSTQHGRCAVCSHRTYRRHLGRWCHGPCTSGLGLAGVADGQRVTVTGRLSNLYCHTAPTGLPWATGVLATSGGPVPVAFYPTSYRQFVTAMAEGARLTVTGFCDRRADLPQLVVLARAITEVAA